ncbi:hypothetical protein E4U42_007541 [Claviceps africana]|uniref:Manganese/iron superoxide dismutase C-terminal domain-containing protein n=1 Tax=Claviceps africana TaxID=83212 RepID=A0A8K0JBA8_9HYPO|nr:hypothetical protein E4U42_007541 [Claviceps africana]
MFRSRLLPRAAKSLGVGLRRTTPDARRSLHRVPALPHDYTKGIHEFYTENGFGIAWTDYMTAILDKLNALTAGTELEDKDTKSISLLTAREPSQAPIFNHASMAHNVHFFFQGIHPKGTPMSDDLRKELESSFSSIATLRREFIVTASAMFGPGFIWLVKVGSGDYRLLTTYLAGSPYPGAHWRAQPVDMNTVGHDGSAASYYKNQVAPKKRNAELPPGGIEMQPLLCLNTWEHAYVYDWGVGAGGGGKIPYVEAWWRHINWERVAHKSGIIRPEFKDAE